MAQETTATIEGSGADRVLVIRVPMNATLEPSKSKKTLVVCSSHGNVKTNCNIEHEGKQYSVVVGVNAYIKPEK